MGQAIAHSPISGIGVFMGGVPNKEEIYDAIVADIQFEKSHAVTETSVRQLCKKHGMDSATFYRWKKKKSWKTAFPEIKEKKEKGLFGKIKSFFGFSKMKCSGCGQEW